jgi:hypothetical protein
MRRRLTSEEREIRGSRGIPLQRWWPLPAILLILLIISGDQTVFERCLGISQNLRGRGAGAFLMLASLPCSPFLLRGSFLEIALFTALLGSVFFAVRNHFWMKRHREYWNGVRQREAERRAEKRPERQPDDK